MTRLDQLKDAVARHLTRIRTEEPSYYVWPIEELPQVIARMRAAIDRSKGLGGISIDSKTFRVCAKEFGIKNTYKAWAAWLATPPLPASWRPEVIADNTGNWLPNGLRFATREEAEASARDLSYRWMAVREHRAAESTEPVNYQYVAGKLVAVT